MILHTHRILRKAYRGLQSKRTNVQFLVLSSFLITFGVTRLVTNLQLRGYLPVQDNDPFHVHHLVFGIFLLLIGGYAGISFWHYETFRYWFAIIFGVGAALTLDEFALWLRLEDVYWTHQGRISIDAVIITASIFGLGFLLSEAFDHKWLKKW